MYYPFANCLNPRRIVNPYTHDTLTVSCGHCKACELRKSSRLSFQCDLESQCHKYTVFVTLTYADEYIPRASVVDNIDRPFGKDLYAVDSGELLGSFDSPQYKIDSLFAKFHLSDNHVPYLRKDDLQKFIKRFRYYASKISEEKVRYFACGEYGPLHFRPHYHLLLWFDSEALLQACYKLVSEAWQFGRIDCQRSVGKCSRYVAGYVNSRCNLPEILMLPAARPFSCHSQKLGQGLFKDTKEKVYSLTADEFIKRSLCVNGTYKEFDLWRSYYAYFYPKCRGFINKSTRERTYSYRLYDTARKVFPYCDTAISLAKEIAQTIVTFGVDRTTFSFDIFGNAVDDKESYDLLSYFNDTFFDNSDLIGNELYDRWVYRIYTELLLSKHFLTYVCDNITTSEITKKVRMIEAFYNRLDYLHLKDFFESQQRFYETDLIGDEKEDLLPFFYDNVPCNFDDLKQSPLYRMFDSSIQQRFYDSIKHKRANDANKIFL